jgi:hypothetical protein
MSGPFTGVSCRSYGTGIGRLFRWTSSHARAGGKRDLSTGKLDPYFLGRALYLITLHSIIIFSGHRFGRRLKPCRQSIRGRLASHFDLVCMKSPGGHVEPFFDKGKGRMVFPL